MTARHFMMSQTNERNERQRHTRQKELDNRHKKLSLFSTSTIFCYYFFVILIKNEEK